MFTMEDNSCLLGKEMSDVFRFREEELLKFLDGADVNGIFDMTTFVFVIKSTVNDQKIWSVVRITLSITD